MKINRHKRMRSSLFRSARGMARGAVDLLEKMCYNVFDPI